MICVYRANLSTNFGDIAITVGLVNLLRRVTDEPVCLVAPPQLRDVHLADLPAVETVTGVPAGARVVYGGGEHLFTGPHLDEWVDVLGDAVVSPGTFGPLDASDRKRVARFSGPVAAREPASARFMSGVLGRDVPVLADPAMFVDERAGDPGGRTIWAPCPDKVGFRAGKYDRQGDPRQWDAFERFLPLIKGDGLIVAHSSRDIPLCRALSYASGVDWYRPRRLHGLVNIYRTASRVVAARFHALVFAYSFGVPFEAVWWPEHGPKIPGLLELDTPVDELRARTVSWFAEALGA